MKYASFIKTLATLCFLSSLFFVNSLAAIEKFYSFGVFPYLPTQKIETIWGPLVAHVSQQLNTPVYLRSRSSYGSFRSSIENELFDISFMQPFVYATIASEHNYVPLARFISLRNKKRKGLLKAIFVTLKENKHFKISDLKNKIIAMPPTTAAVSILGRRLLLDHGLKAGRDYRISSQPNHHSCLRQLIINKPIVCVTAYPSYTTFNPKYFNRLAIMASTEAIPSSVVAVHKRVPIDVRKKIKKILLNLESTHLKQSFLMPAGFIGFVEAKKSDYEKVRGMWKSLISSENNL